MIRYDFPQYSDEWWTRRRGVPTASNFHRIITAKTCTLAAAHKGYIAELIGDELDEHYGPKDDIATAAMRRGTRMEPDARRLYGFWFSAHNGGVAPDIEEVGFCLTDCRRFGSSPDALVGEDGCIEFKCPAPATYASYVLDGGVPNEYLAQVHGHLVVTGRQWCDFMAHMRGQPPLIVRVEADDFTRKLRDCLELFDAAYQAARSKVGLPCRIAAGPAEVLA